MAKILPFVDAHIKAFVEKFTKPGDVIIYTSDHGLSWDKKHDRHHGASLSESGLRMLFAIKGLGVTGTIPKKMVRNIDVGPTIAGLIGDKIPDADGVDLLKKLTPKSLWKGIPDLGVVLETGGRERSPKRHDIFGYRDSQFKYVFDWDLGESLYKVDGERDLKEKLNLLRLAGPCLDDGMRVLE
ncbi:unnamed protein product, partial [marine sediment metagenome]